MDYHLSTTWTVVLILVGIWEVTWKGLALWQAGRKNEPAWFVILLVLNTAGILPMIYLVTHLDKGESS